MSTAGSDLGESLVGRIGFAFSMGLRSGPVAVEFTNRRVAVREAQPGADRSRLTGYRAWRSAVPPGATVCQLIASRYLPADAPVVVEFPNVEVGAIRVSRELGLWTDKTVSDLMISNIATGVRWGPPTAAKPGLQARSPGAGPSIILRVPAPPEVVAGFVRRTPVGAVVAGP